MIQRLKKNLYHKIVIAKRLKCDIRIFTLWNLETMYIAKHNE